MNLNLLSTSLAAAMALRLITTTVNASDPTLIAYYPFNGNASDESGNGNHGTVTGAVLTVDRFGVSASAYQFDGLDDFINCGNAAILNIGSGNLTLTAWVKFSAPQVDKYIVGKYSPPEANAYALGTGTTSAGYGALRRSSISAEVRGDSVIGNNLWHQIVQVFDRTAGVFLYVDGILNASNSSVGALTGDISNTTPLTIGKAANGQNIAGRIDDVRIYSRALSVLETQQLYLDERPPVPPLSSGSVDPLFDPNAGDQVVTAAIQPDGKIVMCGKFTAVGGTSRNRIARVNPDGSLDMGFNPDANGLVYSTAVQTDGKIIVGGLFTQVSGVTRNRIARLNADGSLDTGFNPNASNYIYTVVPQSDGKILIGGGFSAIGGITRQGIARLNADGSLDPGFNPIINGEATTVLLENDGQIIIGGGFTLVGGVGRSRIARLNSDGTLDLSFNPNANNTVYCAALDGSGRILIGGSFSTVGGVARANIARLNSSGAVDMDFDSYADSSVYSIATQTNGKSIIAGILTSTGGQPRNRIAKLSADGSVDTTFNPNANLEVNNAAIQENGDIILSGFFSSVGGIARSKIARVGNEAATESLSISDSSRIEWMRGGAAPETQQVTFDLSIDGGSSWKALGVASRISGGWELTGLALPALGQIRAQARITSGIYCGTQGLVESTSGYDATASQGTWRQFYFGTSSNTGNAADTLDYDLDGLTNLAEYAFGLIPTSSSSCQTPPGQRIGNDFVTSFPTPSGVSGLTYGAEWSTTLLPGSWTPISDTGTPPQHIFIVPIGSNTRMFMRFRVTSP